MPVHVLRCVFHIHQLILQFDTVHEFIMNMRQDRHSKIQLKIKVSHLSHFLVFIRQQRLPTTPQVYSVLQTNLLSSHTIGLPLLSIASKVLDRLICIWCIQDRLPWEKSIQTSQLSTQVTGWVLHHLRSGYWAAGRINLRNVLCSHCRGRIVDSSPA